jgi:hypothetical protein
VLFSDSVEKTISTFISIAGSKCFSWHHSDPTWMALIMKLGLIAMSGVRAHNKVLTKLGLTLPGFVERNKIIASLPSLGLLTLAGMTPDDVNVEYVEIEDIAKVVGLPGDYDVVAISSFSAQIKEAYELAVVDDNSSSLDEKKRLTQRQEIISVSSQVHQL